MGAGTRALSALAAEGRDPRARSLGNGFDLDVARPLLVAGGIGIAPMPYLSEALGQPPALLGYAATSTRWPRGCSPGAGVVVEPRLMTGSSPTSPGDVLACGPEPMLEAVRALVPGAQLAWEAPMWRAATARATAAWSRSTRRYERLCVSGPVLREAA